MKKSKLLVLVIGMLIAIPIIALSFEGFSDSKALFDLYKVSIGSQAEAKLLKDIGPDVLLRVENGYLILLKSGQENSLSKSGLNFQQIASSVNRENLAIDIGLDNSNRDKYPIVYEEDGLRLFRVDFNTVIESDPIPGLSPVPSKSLPIIYKEKQQLMKLSPEDVIDLDSLISLIVQDSLQSYVEALQAFPPRVTGSQSDYDSRDWIYDKFIEFGFDSVFYDTFVYSSSQVQNIIAVKQGSVFPDHHIVVGAHKDAVSSSPGADDNGSGTAGVLEIARVLKDIDTKMTFVFILFDGEEQGLNGSWHYANDAATAGDSIVCMINMDMIGYQGNTDQVKLYHGTDQTYVELYQDLASSLPVINLNGVLSGSISASDHYPFQQNGYSVVFTIEYNFSSVYHTYQDSTSYMDFSYMARIVMGCLATGYQINNTYIPNPGLTFSFPQGYPEVLAPNMPDTFQVLISSTSGGNPVPGTGILYYQVIGRQPVAISMTDLGDDLYEAIIPGKPCTAGKIFYWFSVDEATVGTFYYPDTTNPFSAIIATAEITAFADDFETDLGWSTTGLWQRGAPQGAGGSHGGPDPSNAYSGSMVFGYNLNGDYENSLPERHLTSPAIDCSNMQGTGLKFRRWLGVEQPSYDHAYIRISTDGTTWTTIWQNDSEITDYEWMAMDYDISEYADNQPAVYLRWTMGTTDGYWTYCGWNIDDVEVVGYQCEISGFQITTLDLPDWTSGIPYDVSLTAEGETGTVTWLDKNNDLAGTGLGLSTDGQLTGTPLIEGEILFTALAIDEIPDSVEQSYSFNINPPVGIQMDPMPDATEGVAYNHQLSAIGGTGDQAWTDLNNSLNGSGLTLSSAGLIEGIPVISGSINLMVHVEDEVGDFDEQPMALNIIPAFICGDANGNGSVNILDATYMINYLYLDGPGPVPPDAGDVNNSSSLNILDVNYLINYIYRDGPEPTCP